MRIEQATRLAQEGHLDDGGGGDAPPFPGQEGGFCRLADGGEIFLGLLVGVLDVLGQDSKALPLFQLRLGRPGRDDRLRIVGERDALAGGIE